MNNMFNFSTCSAGMLELEVIENANTSGAINGTCIRAKAYDQTKFDAWLVYRRPSHLVRKNGKTLFMRKLEASETLKADIDNMLEVNTVQIRKDLAAKYADRFYCAVVKPNPGCYIVVKRNDDVSSNEYYRGGKIGEYVYDNDGNASTCPSIDVYFPVPDDVYNDTRHELAHIREAANQQIRDLAEFAISEQILGADIYEFMDHLPAKIDKYIKPLPKTLAELSINI